MKPEDPTQTMPWVDPIVADVRAIRQALLADAGYDLHLLCDRLRDRQASAGRKVVRREPRQAAGTAQDVA